MKSVTSAMATALARTDGQAFRYLLEITPPGGATRYLCADAQTVDAQAYDGELLNLGTLDESLNGIGDMSVTVLDSAANRAAVRLTADVKLKLWAVGTAAADAMTRMWGEVSDPLSIAGGKITFDVVSRASLHDKPVTRLLNTTDFPGADPDAVGRTRPVIYGTLKGAPCLAIDAGSITTLQLDLLTAATSMDVTDAAAFPASGTVQVDIEQMTYTGKTATQLTGLTRGANGTTAVDHDKGAKVAEIQTQYDYLVADHPVKSIDAVYVDGVRQQGTDFTVLPNDGGKAKVRFNTLPTIVRQVNLVTVDGIAVVDTIGVSDGIEVLDTIGVSDTIAVSDTVGVDSSTTADSFDSFQTSTTLPVSIDTIGGFNHGAILDFPAPAGTVKLGQLTIVAAETTGGINTWSADGQKLNILAVGYSGTGGTGSVVDTQTLFTYVKNVGVSKGGPWAATLNGAVRSVKIKWESPGYPLPTNYSWSINNVTLNRSISGVVSNTRTGAASKTGLASKTGAASKTGTVTLVGNSVADTKIGGLVTVDVTGWADDGSGTITGTPNALIDRPDHIARHILTQYGGATAAEAAVVDFDAFTGEVLGCYLDQMIGVRELLKRIATETRAIIVYSGDRWIMRKRKSPGAALDATLVDDDFIAQDSGASSVSAGRAGLRSLANQCLWRAGLSAQRKGWAASDELNDAASQTSYGIRARNISMPDVYDSAQALTVLNWLIARTANPDRAVVSGACDLRHAVLEIGDVVRANHTKLALDETCEITRIRHELAGQRRPAATMTMEAL